MQDDLPPTGADEGRSYFWVAIIAAVAIAVFVAIISNRQGPRSGKPGLPDAAIATAADAGAEAVPDAGDATAKKEAVPQPKGVRPGKEITADQIRGVVKKHQRELATCYRGPQGKLLARKIELALVVQPNGLVSSSAIVTRIPGADNAVDCLNVRVRRWRFPAPGGTVGQEIVVPLIGIRAR
jgi:hypothetical protein